ncbi:1-acyl-sn-glycerol-3-phosphate acyltransferase [Paenibacillus psychroresistens]|uniref:1-acyl-sn-glycerol-3-phosphate acyltransferase n=1 Tax=Paenibacillus psychroresistens TaxID=1778678 RepID=A0A6B8RMC0_9BACL|nr:lysophospholipid acyltransferase family protein [Paenibacillus psychroresistens]QGQ96904.1 1-acyl-sn-glycerol-3-phosphate acyltransferase [Paenibacillus psychroresistens]
MLYRFGRGLFRIMFLVLFRLKAYGKENIPDEGPLIFCGNHRSTFDPPMLGSPIRRELYFMAKEELFRIPIFGGLIRRVHAFPVKRGGVSKDSIRLSIQLLKDGKAMCIFPEGSRNNAGGVGKKGAAMLALRSNAIVIPVAIIGDYKPFRRMAVYYGKPVDLSEYAQSTSDNLEAATDKIMSEIRAMVARYQA